MHTKSKKKTKKKEHKYGTVDNDNDWCDLTLARLRQKEINKSIKVDYV